MSISSIASEYARQHVPSPCLDCPRRVPSCRASCPEWEAYAEAIQDARRMIEANYQKTYAASDFLIASAAMRKTQNQKKKGGFPR